MQFATFIAACFIGADGSSAGAAAAGASSPNYTLRPGVARVLGCGWDQSSVTEGGVPSLPERRFRRETAGLSPAARRYLARLAELEAASREDANSVQAAVVVERLLAEQLANVEPILFFTRYPLTRPNAAGCAIGQSVPRRWGCSIRIWDPARADAPVRTIFDDPEGCIYDMNLSLDATTVFFSYRRKGDACWQIHEIGVDGEGWKRISRDAQCHDTSAVELPGGELLYVSTRGGGYLVSETGPRSNLWTMRRDGSEARRVSQNTLADFSPHLMPDGRVLFTRWEYADRDLDYRMGLWAQRPDGTQFQLYFGNTIREVGIFWQARCVPGHDDVVVATFAPPTGWPYGAIGLVSNRRGPEFPRDWGFAWLTDEVLAMGDPVAHTDGMSYFDVDDGRLLNLALRDDRMQGDALRGDLSRAHELEARAGSWLSAARPAYRDPLPVSDYLFLVAYAEETAGRFDLHLLDLCGNRIRLYADSRMGSYNPLLLRRRNVFAMPRQKDSATGVEDQWGTILVADVYQGMPNVARGQACYLQVMEQLPKTHEYARRAYDQSPVMGYGTYYAKRCWGRVPLEADGSAHVLVPGAREIYLQVLDGQGRELQRQTSSIQVMPGEVRGCVGCHEPRTIAPPRSLLMPMAAAKPPARLDPPTWGNRGLIDFVTVVQPVLDKHCVRCHGGPCPEGGCDLSSDATRLFNMAYDHLLGRSESYRQHNLTTGAMLSQEAARGRPLVHFFWLRRAPTGINRPLGSGSHVSRIDAYLDEEHCGTHLSWDERQRIYTWIDANVPYYADYAASRPLTPGARDLWADADTGQEADWFANRFLEVYRRRCVTCHGLFPHPNDHDNLWSGQYAWINLTNPRRSAALTAHLSREAGGRGLPTRRFVDEPPLFASRNDPDYVIMLQAIREGRRRMLARPRVDMRVRSVAGTVQRDVARRTVLPPP